MISLISLQGVLSGSYGITMNQFGQILDLKTTDLSLGLSAQAIFGCVASLIATYTLDRWNRNLQYAIDVFLLSIVIILFPFANSTAEYLFYSSAIGFFTSVSPKIFHDFVFSLNQINLINKFFVFSIQLATGD